MSEDPATRIQEAATALFAEHGFEGVSVRDIAGRARVTVGSINYYFGSKLALYQECARRLAQSYLAEAREQLEREGPQGVLRHYVDFAARDRRLIQMWLDLQTARDPERRLFSNREILQPIQSFLLEAIQRTSTSTTLDQRLRMVCFAGAVVLRSMLTDEQLEILTGAAPGEADAAWREVLFSRLLDD